MKLLLRITLVSILFIASKTNTIAQVKIDETNLLTRLKGLINLNSDDAEKYFTDQHYTRLSKQTVAQPTYSMDLYKFKIQDQTSSYLLSAIAGSINAAGYITYNEDEYQADIKIFKDAGFVPGEASSGSGQTVYAKENMRVVIQQKTAGGKVFYVMMLSDIAKTAALIGAKK